MKGKGKTRKWLMIAVWLICCILPVGCGKARLVGSGYFDIVSETEALADVLGEYEEKLGGKRQAGFFGAQFYQGEPVQLWGVLTGDSTDVWMHHVDGSRELLLESMLSRRAISGSGYLDSEGNLYCWQMGGTLSRTSPAGERYFSKALSELGISEIGDIRQTQDGKVFLKYKEADEKNVLIWILGELDPDTGEISEIRSDDSGITYMGTGEDGLYSLDGRGLWKVSEGDGSKTAAMLFAGSTYGMDMTGSVVHDFRIREDGAAEILRTDYQGGSWTMETIREMELGRGKTPLVVRGWSPDRWLKAQAAAFNLSDSSYFVVFDECGSYADREDCALQTSVEVAAGEGPELFLGDVLGDYTYGTIQKGGILDLSPYLKDEGIRTEDYFPCTFGWQQDGGGIYGVSLMLDCGTYYMEAEELGADREPDIEELVDALLSREGEEVFLDDADSREVLELFLGGSENLWGMVDWEAGECDFSGELFADILEAAKRYGDNGRNNYSGLAMSRRCGLYYFMGNVYLWNEASGELTTMKVEWEVPVGGLFDDGCHAVADPSCTLSVNAGTSGREGAWEFIRFLLGEEAQSAIAGFRHGNSYPVDRQAAETYIERVVTGEEEMAMLYMTEEDARELEEMLEGARYLPVRPKPILDIICKEAEDYFAGLKDVGEIGRVVENRVQLYLDEHRF